MKTKFKLSTVIDHNESKKAKEKEDEDILINAIGEFGRWHLMLLFLIIYPIRISSIWQSLGIIFLAPKTNFRCTSTNLTSSIQMSKCYDDCKKYEYFTEFENTIISQWNLVCNRAWMSNFTQIVNMFGILIGSIVFGFIADRFGRRIALLSACVLQLSAGLIESFASSYWLFTSVRFFLGASTAGTLLCSFILIIEVVSPNKRELMTCLSSFPIPIGEMIMPAIAYYLRTWDKFSLGVSLPSIMFLAYFFVMPESPKWLISMGRLDEANDVMKQAAKWNNLPTENMMDVVKKIASENTKAGPQEKASYADLFKTKKLRLHILCSCINWFVLGVSYYGSNQYIGQTSSNVFISISLAGALQIPGMLVGLVCCKYFGRRITLISMFTVCGISNAFLAVPNDWFYVRLVMGTIGVSCASGCFSYIYMYTTELFPTVARNMALGASSTASRLGSMLAPFVVGLNVVSHFLPPAAFAVVPLIAAVSCYCLPETKGKKLADQLT